MLLHIIKTDRFQLNMYCSQLDGLQAKNPDLEIPPVDEEEEEEEEQENREPDRKFWENSRLTTTKS